MKRFIYISCIILLVFTACIGEDMSNCPPVMNAVLTFSYTGDTSDPSMFGKMINHVTLLIYDSNDDKVFEQRLSEKELREFQGAQLSLEPGNYRAVCWGNANEYTEIKDRESFDTGRVHHPAFITGKEIATNSHLYYGIYDFLVPTYGTGEWDIPFIGAHINMEVYIRTSIYSSGYGIQVHNVMPQYDFGMDPVQPFATTYHPQIEYNTEKKLEECLFQVLRFDDDNQVVVEVIQPHGKRLNVNLKDYMAENNITVEGKNEITVPILLEFDALGVVIKVPEWLATGVTPGT